MDNFTFAYYNIFNKYMKSKYFWNYYHSAQDSRFSRRWSFKS